jgi:signal transduction histidine kinase
MRLAKIYSTSIISLLTTLTFTATAFAQENCGPEKKKAICDEKLIKSKVDQACAILSDKGKAGVDDIKKLRFDCCGEPDYVWINDLHPKMIMHPIKPQLDGTDLTANKDPDGKALFVEFVKAVKSKPAGSWVDYKWTKLGDSDPTPKKSWVRKCKAKDVTEEWVVGSGTWK